MIFICLNVKSVRLIYILQSYNVKFIIHNFYLYDTLTVTVAMYSSEKVSKKTLLYTEKVTKCGFYSVNIHLYFEYSPQNGKIRGMELFESNAIKHIDYQYNSSSKIYTIE